MRRAATLLIGGIAAAAPALARDLAAVGGSGLISYGAWLAYPPAGYIALGALLLAASIISGRRVS